MIHPLYHFYKNCMNGQLEIIVWKILSFFLDGTELYARPDTLSYNLVIKVHCLIKHYQNWQMLIFKVLYQGEVHTPLKPLFQAGVNLSHFWVKSPDLRTVTEQWKISQPSNIGEVDTSQWLSEFVKHPWNRLLPPFPKGNFQRKISHCTSLFF